MRENVSVFLRQSYSQNQRLHRLCGNRGLLSRLHGKSFFFFTVVVCRPLVVWKCVVPKTARSLVRDCGIDWVKRKRRKTRFPFVTPNYPTILHSCQSSHCFWSGEFSKLELVHRNLKSMDGFKSRNSKYEAKRTAQINHYLLITIL